MESQRARVRTALQMAGLDQWSCVGGNEIPCVIDVASAAGDSIFRLAPVGFYAAGAAERLWLTAEQVDIVCTAFADLVPMDGRFATEPEAETLWRLLSRAAGDNAHIGGSHCACYGCNHQRRRIGMAPPRASEGSAP